MASPESASQPQPLSNTPARVLALRQTLADAGLDGYFVPRSDAFQNESPPPRDRRLEWLTGFSGSAGQCLVLREHAAIISDGRYRLQLRQQVDLNLFTLLESPKQSLAHWAGENLKKGAKIGFDSWLYTHGQIEAMQATLDPLGVALTPMDDNLLDTLWHDQPARPAAPMTAYNIKYAGEAHADKRARIAKTLREAGQASTIITAPDALAWLLNTRGGDLEHTPVALAFGILFEDGRMALFIDPAKTSDELRQHLGDEVKIYDLTAFLPAVLKLKGKVRLDKATIPYALSKALTDKKTAIAFAPDPIALPKACKNPAELKGTQAAHIRDGVAMCEFLCWLDSLGADPKNITELDIVAKLESLRSKAPTLRGLSFDTIAGSGANGAIIHYRATKKTNREIKGGELLLVDSGGQYIDGTTDITRTIAIGKPPARARQTATLVLRGMIALSNARFPAGLAGRDLDALARAPLWSAGLDYAHGTGHGVGAYLSVHEGPQGISARAMSTLHAGMILSNEPGYYKDGQFGIRIENLMFVKQSQPTESGAEAHDMQNDMLCFETLTLAPIDKTLIEPSLMTGFELDWLNAYHAKVERIISPLCSPPTKTFLTKACSPLTTNH